MGESCSKSEFRDLPKKVLIIGNAGAGKTRLLYSWVLGRTDFETVPTNEFNAERVMSRNLYIMWDLCGKDIFKVKRRQFYHGSEGLVYMIDATCFKSEDRKDLEQTICERDLSTLPLLIVINNKEGITVDWKSEFKFIGKTERRWSFINVDLCDMTSMESALTELDALFEDSEK